MAVRVGNSAQVARQAAIMTVPIWQGGAGVGSIAQDNLTDTETQSQLA